MNTISIDTKIAEIIKSTDKPFQCVFLRIECPLDTGILVECWRVAEQEKFSQFIPGGVRVFFQFVEKLRQEQPQTIFNVVEILIENTGKYTVSTSFDDSVQKRAEENIKQDR